MTNDAVYPGAPLRYVTFELRFPAVPPLASQDRREALYDQLREVFPVSQSVPTHASEGGGQPADELRMVDRARTRSVRIGVGSLVVQTSAYERYSGFREWIELAVRALEKVESIPALERIGVRYTDEIRVPGVEEPEGWKPYIHESLLGPIDLSEDYKAWGTQGLVDYQVAEQQHLVMRYGSGDGWYVNPDGPLRLPDTEYGAYFLIDLDSFWVAPEEELPEFSAGLALDICTALHHPVRVMFEAAITERLREEVLRKEAT